MSGPFNFTPTYVTVPDIKDVTAGKILGRGSASGNGDAQEITIGTGLSLSGTTLTATGGGGSGISEFTVDGGDSTTVFAGGGYLTVDFGGSV
jgi:hypothetical protein